MTDFRNLRPDHDLRSQLGLKNPGMTDLRRISLGLPPLNEQNQESLREEIADALRHGVKPLSPDQATLVPLHKIIAVTGCTNQAQARRIHKWFEGQNNVVVNVTNNDSPYQDKNASEIAASIRKLIDSPGYLRMRAIGKLSAGPTSAIDILNAAERFHGEPVDLQTLQPYPKRSIQLDETQISEMHLDVRAIARLIPEGAVLIKGFTVNEYLDAHPGTEPVIVKEGDITAAHPITEDLASVLRGIGLHTAGGPVQLPGVGKLYATGGPVGKPTHRDLSKIHDHVENRESDILELLVEAGANPHADRRRLESARTQFELAFMMMKKAVDPEQERE